MGGNVWHQDTCPAWVGLGGLESFAKLDPGAWEDPLYKLEAALVLNLRGVHFDTNSWAVLGRCAARKPSHVIFTPLPERGIL